MFFCVGIGCLVKHFIFDTAESHGNRDRNFQWKLFLNLSCVLTELNSSSNVDISFNILNKRLASGRTEQSPQVLVIDSTFFRFYGKQRHFRCKAGCNRGKQRP